MAYSRRPKTFIGEVFAEYEGPFNREDIALIAARIVCGQLQDFLFPGASLRQQDFASPPVVVTPYHGRADQRYWFRAGILNFFDGDERVDAIEIPGFGVATG